jgi:hypothetical protein
MNEIDFIAKLSEGRNDLLEKTALKTGSMRRALMWSDRHPHMTSAILSGGLSAGLSAANATPGERMDAALRGGARGAVIGSILSHGMAKLRKTAGVAQETKNYVKAQAKNLLAHHKTELVGGAVGGVGLGALQYKLSKKNPKTGVSVEQDAGQKAVKASHKMREETKAKGKDPGLVSDISHGSAKFYKDVADSFAKHPVKGALMAIPTGAAVGSNLAKRMFK